MIIENTSFPFAEDYNKFVPVTCDTIVSSSKN